MQNARVITFAISELLRENKQGGKITRKPRLGLSKIIKSLKITKKNIR